jgi:hypothetical protein
LDQGDLHTNKAAWRGNPLTLIVVVTRRTGNRSRSAALRDAPVTLTVLVVHTGEVLLSRCPVNAQLQWLVHIA